MNSGLSQSADSLNKPERTGRKVSATPDEDFIFTKPRRQDRDNTLSVSEGTAMHRARISADSGYISPTELIPQPTRENRQKQILPHNETTYKVRNCQMHMYYVCS